MAKTVMIVEDNELNMKLFNDVLEANGYAVVQTNDGMKAMDLARAAKPDLVLMDIQLPEVSGLDVIKWMKGGRRTRLHSHHRDNRLRHEGRRGEDPCGRMRGLHLETDQHREVLGNRGSLRSSRLTNRAPHVRLASAPRLPHPRSSMTARDSGSRRPSLSNRKRLLEAKLMPPSITTSIVRGERSGRALGVRVDSNPPDIILLDVHDARQVSGYRCLPPAQEPITRYSAHSRRHGHRARFSRSGHGCEGLECRRRRFPYQAATTIMALFDPRPLAGRD